MTYAIKIHKTGGPEVLSWEGYDPGTPGDGEVLVTHDSLLAAKGSLFLTRPSLMQYTAVREDLLAHARDLFEVVTSGAVKIDITREYALKDAAQAHRDLEGRKTTGSSVLLP